MSSAPASARTAARQRSRSRRAGRPSSASIGSRAVTRSALRAGSPGSSGSATTSIPTTCRCSAAPGSSGARSNAPAARRSFTRPAGSTPGLPGASSSTAPVPACRPTSSRTRCWTPRPCPPPIPSPNGPIAGSGCSSSRPVGSSRSAASRRTSAWRSARARRSASPNQSSGGSRPSTASGSARARGPTTHGTWCSPRAPGYRASRRRSRPSFRSSATSSYGSSRAPSARRSRGCRSTSARSLSACSTASPMRKRTASRSPACTSAIRPTRTRSIARCPARTRSACVRGCGGGCRSRMESGARPRCACTPTPRTGTSSSTSCRRIRTSSSRRHARVTGSSSRASWARSPPTLRSTGRHSTRSSSSPPRASKVVDVRPLGALVAIALLSAGCAPATTPSFSTDAPRRGGTVVFAWQQPETLHPLYSTGTQTNALVYRLAVEGLVGIGPDGEPYPALAEEVPTTANGGVALTGGVMTVRYRLREGITWSDGAPLTAEDVRFTWRTITSDPRVATREGYDQIDAIDVADLRTAIVRYRGIYPAYATRFDALLPRHLLEGAVPVVRALVRGTRKAGIVEKLLLGRAGAGTSGIPVGWAAAPGLAQEPYDPDAARRMLEDAGWRAGADGIRRKGDVRAAVRMVSTTGNKLREQVEQVLVDEWRAVGVEATIRNVPSSVLTAGWQSAGIRKRGDFDVLLANAGLGIGSTDPQSYLAQRHRCASIPRAENQGAGANYERFCDERVDRLLDEAGATLDLARRRAAYAEVLRVLNERVVAIWLFDRGRYDAFRSRIGGYRSNGWDVVTWNAQEWFVRD